MQEIEEGRTPQPILSKSIIVSTGATAKRLYITGEDVYWQAGISACAVCDGAAPIFRNKPLAGFGNLFGLLIIQVRGNQRNNFHLHPGA